jgi:hypothetical protein
LGEHICRVEQSRKLKARKVNELKNILRI